MLSAIRDWLGGVIPVINLLVLLLAANKVLRKVQQDYEERGRRIDDHEERIRAMETEAKKLIAVETTIAEMKEEMGRIRDRLDRLLDKLK